MITYAQALDTRIRYTDIAYTLASQDRLWLLVSLDDVSVDEWRGSDVYLCYGEAGGMDGHYSSYDRCDETVVFESRREAEAYLVEHADALGKHSLMPVNMGDHARHDYWRCGMTKRFKPRFPASTEPYLQAKKELA